MKIKEFLKLTKWKIVIFLALFIVFVPFISFYTDNIIPFIYYLTHFVCIQAPCYNRAVSSILIWLLYQHRMHRFGIQYLILISGSIISYLLSCLIIFIYKKFNTKSKNKKK